MRAQVAGQTTGLPSADAPVRLERRRDGSRMKVGSSRRTGRRLRVGGGGASGVGRQPFPGGVPGTETVAPGVSGVTGGGAGPGTDVMRCTAARVVDETEVTLAFRWLTRDGRPVPGLGRVWSRSAGQKWRRGPRLRVRPRRRGRAPGRPTRRQPLEGRRPQRSLVGGRGLRRPPPGQRAPGRTRSPTRGRTEPRVRVPRRPRAVGDGPNGSVSAISDAVWGQIPPAGCGCRWGRAAAAEDR